MAARLLRSPRTLPAILVILVAGLGSFGGSVGCGFVYDDVDLVRHNDRLKAGLAGAPGLDGRPASHLTQLLTHEFSTFSALEAEANTTPLGYFRPVIAFSYLSDAWFWGTMEPYPAELAGRPLEPWRLQWQQLNPFGFHLSNLLFHLLNALLVFLVARALFGGSIAALAAGVLFAVHPVHTENVCWIAGRTDVIATTFFLAALWAYLRHRRRAAAHGRLAYAAALTFALVAGFTKEAALVLGPVLLALELTLAHPRQLARGRAVLRTLPFFAVVVVWFLVRATLTERSGPDAYVDIATGGPIPILTLVLSFLQAGGWYLAKCLWPFPLVLYGDLPFVAPGDTLIWGAFLALHLALAGGAVWLAWKRIAPRLAFAILAFYLALAPLANILPGARLVRFIEDQDFPVAERFLYIPSLFVVLAIALGFARLAARARAQALGLLVLIAVAGAAVSAVRTTVYRDSATFFFAAAATAPRSARMQCGLGSVELQRFQPEAALLHFQFARHLVDVVHRRSMLPPIPEGLIQAYRMLDDTARVSDVRQKALRDEGNNPLHAHELARLMWTDAILHMDVARLDFALQMERRAAAQAPANPLFKRVLGHLERTRGTWQRYFMDRDRSDATLASMGMTFYVPGRGALMEQPVPRWADALVLFHQGLRHTAFDPAQVNAFPETARIRVQLETRFDETLPKALREVNARLERFPESAAVHFELAEILRAAWEHRHNPADRDAALAAYRRAAELNPGFVRAVLKAARVLSARKQQAAALALANAAVDELLRARRLDPPGWDAPLRPYRALDVVRGLAEPADAGPLWTAWAVERVEQILARVAARLDEPGGRENATYHDDHGWFLDYTATHLRRPELFPAAAAAFRRAIALDPKHPRAAQNLAAVEKKIRQIEQEKQNEPEKPRKP